MNVLGSLVNSALKPFARHANNDEWIAKRKEYIYFSGFMAVDGVVKVYEPDFLCERGRRISTF